MDRYSGDASGRFAGRVAVVTGAAQGMGLAISHALAQEGAAVVLNDISAEALERAGLAITGRGGVAWTFPGSVTVAADVRRLVANAIDVAGRIDLLVNNAGVLRSTPVEGITEEEWDLVVDVLLKGPFLCSQAVLPHMREQHYGKIVNLASMAGRATSTLGGAHYTAAKAGLLGLSRHLARECAPDSINVNAVCPGIVDTPMSQAALTRELAARVMADIPFGRLGTPYEVARLVLFLLSDDASYITGASVDIHGGELIIA